MAGKKKEPKFQPTKYDWDAIEIEFMESDISSVDAFFRSVHPSIPRRTRTKRCIGWGQKRDAIRKSGVKIIAKGLARDYAEAMKNHLNWGSGLIKAGIEALVPSKDGSYAGMKPQSAGEAAKLIHLGTVIQKNAIQTSGMMEEMLKDKSFLPDGLDGGGQVPNTVIIDIPSNSKELPGK